MHHDSGGSNATDTSGVSIVPPQPPRHTVALARQCGQPAVSREQDPGPLTVDRSPTLYSLQRED